MLTTDQRQDLVSQAQTASNFFTDLAINERHNGNAAVVNALLSIKCAIDAVTAQLAANAND